VKSPGPLKYSLLSSHIEWVLHITVLLLISSVSYCLAENEASPRTSGTEKRFKNKIGMTLVKIPAGEFLMGSPPTEKWRSDDEQQHRVRITKPFYMATTEVTQKQWNAVMGTEPWKDKNNIREGANFPAGFVNWNEATAFCRKLSQKEGRTYRLPTEAEWEYACRAGSTTKYCFGADDKHLGDYAWYDENTYDVDEYYAHQAGVKKANQFGLYDMHGNVFEWCRDWYDEDYYEKSPPADPQGPSAGAFPIFRGGSWYGFPRICRSAYRSGGPPGYRNFNVGFRVVCEQD